MYSETFNKNNISNTSYYEDLQDFLDAGEDLNIEHIRPHELFLLVSNAFSDRRFNIEHNSDEAGAYVSIEKKGMCNITITSITGNWRSDIESNHLIMIGSIKELKPSQVDYQFVGQLNRQNYDISVYINDDDKKRPSIEVQQSILLDEGCNFSNIANRINHFISSVGLLKLTCADAEF